MFKQCIHRLTASLRGCFGDWVTLDTLLWHFEMTDKTQLYADVRREHLSTIAQLWWRFENRFEDWPWRLFTALGPDATPGRMLPCSIDTLGILHSVCETEIS
jgi:hypothetical protein